MKEGNLLLAWQATRIEHGRIERNCHDHSEVVYFLTGSGEFELDGMTFSFTQGDFACIPPHTPHGTVHHSTGQVLYIRYTGFHELPCCFSHDSTRELEYLMRDLLRETQTQLYEHGRMVALKMNELPLLIQRCLHHRSTPKNFEYIVNFLRENYHTKLRLTDCAQQLHVSYDYFQHKFKEIVGVSPQQFLIEQRLSASERLLQDSTLSCTEIAFRCGFSTSAQFSSLFKKRYGVSPHRFRKEV